MPYSDPCKALDSARKSQGKYRAKNRRLINAKKRAKYNEDIEESRRALRDTMRERYDTSKEFRKKVYLSSRARMLWKFYRLTLAAYALILEHQGGVCAGCGEPPRKTSLAVDHCHKSGRIRGLLCWFCNRSVGLFRDRPDVANNLGRYLTNPPAPAALGEETYGLVGQAKYKKKMVYGPPENK